VQPGSRAARFAYNRLAVDPGAEFGGGESICGDLGHPPVTGDKLFQVPSPHCMSPQPIPCPDSRLLRCFVPVPGPRFLFQAHLPAWHISYPVPPAGLRPTTIRNGDPPAPSRGFGLPIWRIADRNPRLGETAAGLSARLGETAGAGCIPDGTYTKKFDKVTAEAAF
jgi:hypothetical protein